jgi:peptidoglycan/LPS O-acetylase OafA/YrhL
MHSRHDAYHFAEKRSRVEAPSFMPRALDDSRAAVSTTGFDALRLALAILILWSHSGWIQYLNTIHSIPRNLMENPIHAPEFRSLFRTTSAMAVPMFFVLSGYLIAGSAERANNVRVFLVHRILRIVPALTVEVTLSAVVIGALFTNMTAYEYFTSKGFYDYLLNIIGIVHFHLPGVFEKNNIPGYVNVNLWTLPIEYYCYFAMAVCLCFRVHKNRGAVLWMTVFAYMVFVLSDRFNGSPVINGENFKIRFIILLFFIGACFYLYRSEIVMNFWLFVVALMLGLGLMSYYPTLVFSAPFVSYATVYIGTRNLRLPEFFRRNDYSYGVYLYGFPIAQSLSAAFPGLREMRYSFRFAAIGVTAVFAAFSWHFVERHFLALKPRVSERFLRPAPTAMAKRARDQNEAPLALSHGSGLSSRGAR